MFFSSLSLCNYYFYLNDLILSCLPRTWWKFPLSGLLYCVCVCGHVRMCWLSVEGTQPQSMRHPGLPLPRLLWYSHSCWEDYSQTVCVFMCRCVYVCLHVNMLDVERLSFLRLIFNLWMNEFVLLSCYIESNVQKEFEFSSFQVVPFFCFDIPQPLRSVLHFLIFWCK